MKLARVLLLSSMAAGLIAQTPTWDTSGNGMLNGTYYFRQVIYELSSAGDGTLYDALAFYGTVTFSGTGTYTMVVTLLDGQSGQFTARQRQQRHLFDCGFRTRLPFQSVVPGLRLHRRRSDLRPGERAGYFRGQQHGKPERLQRRVHRRAAGQPAPSRLHVQGLVFPGVHGSLQRHSDVHHRGNAANESRWRGQRRHGDVCRIRRARRPRARFVFQCEIHLQQRRRGGDLPQLQHRAVYRAILPVFFARRQLRVRRVAQFV